MLFFQILRTAFRGIIANKMRTSLTMLGIIIGVGAIIAMLSLGEGAKQQVMESMSRFGTNVLRVRPGAARMGHVRTGRVETLTIGDAEALVKEVPGIKLLSPVVASSTQVKYSNRNASTLITGTTPEYIEINNFQVAEGSFFEQTDIKLVRRVAAIGSTVRQELFGEGPAIGEDIKIEGQTSFSDPDDQIFIPVTTSQRRVFFQDYVSDITIQVEEAGLIPSVKEGVERVLRARHRILPGAESDFSIRDFTEMMMAMQETTRTFTVLLSGIAAVSLLVGGIGVMNIMLVSVTERTREIGIRMAVGARRKDILRQFLIEALAITVSGGIIGIGAGVSIAELLSRFGEWGTVITFWSIALGFCFSALVGLVFGIYPARKASLMDPIEALRYE
ncbi:MAG: ABC transporter permease [Deltaproteobacteria bacterium]|nr:ABC transporter permease [Deltaproteobacteria bacterium]